MRIKNEPEGNTHAPETKRLDSGWYEKYDITANEAGYLEELLRIDRALAECDNILSEVNLQIGYQRYESRIYEIAEKRQHLWNFILALPEYIEAHLDEPLYQSLNRGASETISRIHMQDFTVENTLGVTMMPTDREYYGQPQRKDRLNLEDFIGNAIGEQAEGNLIAGRNRECVEEFAAIFAGQYESMSAMGVLEDETTLEIYLDQFAAAGEYDHKVEQPFHLMLLTNLLDLTIIKPIIESCCGYDLITGEDLTEMEQNMKLIGAFVDLITLATGLSGFMETAKTLGMKQVARLVMVELTADAAATAVATIGEYHDWPPGLTMRLSLGTGITVGQIGNHLVFEKDGIEICRRECGSLGNDTVIEGGTGVLDNANYAQRTYSNTFSPEGRKIYSDLAGEPINTIDDLVNAINSGKVNVADLTVEYIVRDGNTLILNTRTSQALTQAGIPRSQWNAIDRTGDALFEELLTGQLSRNKLTSEGISTVRPSGGQ